MKSLKKLLLISLILFIMSLFVYNSYTPVSKPIYKKQDGNEAIEKLDIPEEEKEHILNTIDEQIKQLEQIFDESVNNLICPKEKRPRGEANLCDPGFTASPNDKGEMCCFIDPDKLGPTEREQYEQNVKMGTKLVGEIALGVVVDAGISKAVKTGPKKMLKNTANVAKKAMAKLKSKLGKKMGEKMTTKISQKVTLKTAGIVAKFGAKIGVKSASMGAKTAAKVGMGPVGWALVAVDIFSFALDSWDPMDFSSFIPHTDKYKTRDLMEATFEDTNINNGLKYPMLVDYMYSLSEEDNEMFLAVFNESEEMTTIMEDLQTKVIDTTVTKLAEIEFIETGEDLVIELDKMFDKISDEEFDKEFNKIIDGPMDKILCSSFNKFKKDTVVEWVEGVGCSLNSKGCSAYNSHNDSKGYDEQDNMGVFSKYYRIRDKASDIKTPKMVTKTFDEAVCFSSNLTLEKKICEGKSYQEPDSDGKMTTISKRREGNWDKDNGICSYTKDFCHSKGMEHETYSGSITTCDDYAGAGVASIIFGDTLTKGTIHVANEINDWGDKAIDDVGDWGETAIDDVGKFLSLF